MTRYLDCTFADRKTEILSWKRAVQLLLNLQQQEEKLFLLFLSLKPFFSLEGSYLQRDTNSHSFFTAWKQNRNRSFCLLYIWQKKEEKDPMVCS